MAKMELTAAEVELIEKARKGKEMDLSDAETALITARRAPRKYTLDDVEPENWAKLSDAEKTECKRQVTAAAEAALRGE